MLVSGIYELPVLWSLAVISLLIGVDCYVTSAIARSATLSQSAYRRFRQSIKQYLTIASELCNQPVDKPCI